MRLGDNKGTDKNTENGKLYFGDKDMDFLEKTSRTALEDNNNMPILYLGLDWINCKRNFYGEMTVKKFINPKGVKIYGSYKIEQNPITHQNGIPYKTMKINVSIYTEQLKELQIDPMRGDYFYIGSRYYQIFDLTINDLGPGTVMMRKRMRCDYSAFEVDDSTIQKSINEQNPGPAFNINNFTQGTQIE